jgi:hypothetical protein
MYTAGGLQVTYDSYFSSSVFVNGNLTVFGTQSVVHVSSSQLNIGTNIITVNTSTPSIRYGGLSVYDSGSTGLSGSIFWDSEANHWVYANASGSGGGDTYTGGMFISGPRNTRGLGCEQGTTSCMLLVGQGGDHLTSSMIYHSSTVTCVPNALNVGGALSGTSAAFSGNLGIGGISSADIIGYGTNGILGILGAAGNPASIQLGVVGTAAATTTLLGDINVFGLNGGSSVVARTIIRSALDGATNSTKMDFFTMSSGTLASRLTIACSGAATFSSSVRATQFTTGGTPSNTAGFTNSFYAESAFPSITLSNTGGNTGKYTLGVTAGLFGIWNNATSAYELEIDPIASGLIKINRTATFSSTVATTGVVFPATQVASANANTLDDYEEGTYTPDIRNGSWAFGARSGFYTKIGNLVTVNLLIVWTANNIPSGASFEITLPFTAFGSGNFRAPATIGYTSGINFNTSRQLVAHVDMSNNYLSFQQIVSGGAPIILSNADINNSGETQISVTYQV